jgi:hypothetical protein
MLCRAFTADPKPNRRSEDQLPCYGAVKTQSLCKFTLARLLSARPKPKITEPSLHRGKPLYLKSPCNAAEATPPS